MELLQGMVDLFLHLDRHLSDICRAYGAWTYLILFLVVFAETGLVITPFLPGDSLLFAAGALAGLGALDPWLIFILLSAAAIAGDTVNYWIGHYLGPRVLRSETSWIFRRDYLDRTHAFFERYGGKTIIIARFVPIVRTFAPFVAGVGAMHYGKFITYNVVGGILWVGICSFAGYFFGSLEFVKKNFALVVLAIILISVMPAVVEVVRHRREQARSRRAIERLEAAASGDAVR